MLSCLSVSWRYFLYSSSVYSCHHFLICSVSLRSIPFLSIITPIFPWNVPLVFPIFLKRSLSSSVIKWCSTLCDPMDCSIPGLPVHHQLLEFTQIHVYWSVMPSNHLILCCPLLLPPSIFPSSSAFSNKSVLPIRWPKYWSFSFGISPSNEHSGLISFRIDWLDLLAIQGILRSFLQHYSLKALILCAKLSW